MTSSSPLVSVRDLVKHYPLRGGLLSSKPAGAVQAVDGISFDIYRGETLGLVGESGCGKTTAGRAILYLQPPSAGQILFDNQDLGKLNAEALRRLRRRMQMIFQDPYASLNARWTVGRIVGEPLRVHEIGDRQEQQQRTLELLELVQLNPLYINRYPHEFSGGQRQRIGIARALALKPKLIVCDEPVSALDVSIRAQVINLLEDLQHELGLAYLFIAHDLSVVKHTSDRIAVMYLGKIVETAASDTLSERPQHPYTEALLSAVPVPDPAAERLRRRIVLTGDVPSPASPPSGCVFHPRCPRAQEVCATLMPTLLSTGADAGDGHQVACYFPARWHDGVRSVSAAPFGAEEAAAREADGTAARP